MQFFLLIVAVGCANPVLTPDFSVKRSAETLSVTCNATSQSWRLVCKDGAWVGDIGNCTQPGKVLEIFKINFFQKSSTIMKGA